MYLKNIFKIMLWGYILSIFILGILMTKAVLCYKKIGYSHSSSLYRRSVKTSVAIWKKAQAQPERKYLSIS